LQEKSVKTTTSGQLALTLFMFWFTANYTHNAVALDDFAVTAQLLDGSTNFHFNSP
jgi:hypothetical protein